jgi:hypothetical protein
MKTAKISFEDVVIRLHTAESKGRILAHSPSGKVPALKIEENGVSQTVWDSLAISETLAERHPEARLWPEAASARAHARSVVAEMHSGFQPLRRALSMEIAARHATPTLEDDVQADIARIVAIWTGALAAHGGEGGSLSAGSASQTRSSRPSSPASRPTRSVFRRPLRPTVSAYWRSRRCRNGLTPQKRKPPARRGCYFGADLAGGAGGGVCAGGSSRPISM